MIAGADVIHHTAVALEVALVNVIFEPVGPLNLRNAGIPQPQNKAMPFASVRFLSFSPSPNRTR
jgi:hypothetical protein